MRLYFFPALLPFASIIPGILAVVGATAAAVVRLKHRKKLALILTLISAISLIAALGTYARRFFAKTNPSTIDIEHLPEQDTSGYWHQLTPREPLSNLAFSQKHGLIVFGTKQRTIDAISITDATLRFSIQMSEPVFAEPLIDGDTLYATEGLHDAINARLLAARLPAGKILWQQHFGSHLESSPRLSKDRKVLWGCAGDAGIYSVATSDGSVLWQKSVGHCDTTPLVDGNTLYAVVESAPRNSKLLALAAATGDISFEIELPGQPWGTPAIDPLTGYLLVTTGIGRVDPSFQKDETGWLHAIDVRNRKTLWNIKLSGMPLMIGIMISENGNTLSIHAVKNGEVSAFDTRNGELKWKFRTKSPVLAPPLLIDPHGELVIHSFDGTIYRLNATTGELYFTAKINPVSTSIPAVGKEQIFFATRDGIWGLPLANKIQPWTAAQ